MLNGEMALLAIITGKASLNEDDVIFHTSHGDEIVPILQLNNEDCFSKLSDKAAAAM